MTWREKSCCGAKYDRDHGKDDRERVKGNNLRSEEGFFEKDRQATEELAE